MRYIFCYIFLFLLNFCTRNFFHWEWKLLRVRLTMKKLPNFNVFIQEINKYRQYTHNSTRKEIYEQYVLFDLDIFSFLLIFCTRNYIYCDQKPHKLRLIIKYLRTFKIFIEEIKK